jgi:23S rRNA pseudouridine1911/1915/1917 synthase
MINENNILYESNHLIIINKPCGILSQGDSSDRPNLLDEVRNYIKHTYNKPGNVFVGLVHRLDYPVSGAIIYGKTSKGASRISAQIRNRELRKIYIAATHGTVSFPNWTLLTAYLYRDGDKTFITDKNSNSSQFSSLIIKTIQTSESGNFHIIELLTGRKHQIRAQLSAENIPIVGDTKYGSEINLSNSILLHCRRLIFYHPISGDAITIEAPLHTEFLKIISEETLSKKITITSDDIIDKFKEESIIIENEYSKKKHR